MRYNNFSKQVVSETSFLIPERLPPNEYATKLHSRRLRRVYYQIMTWIGKAEGMDAME